MNFDHLFKKQVETTDLEGMLPMTGVELRVGDYMIGVFMDHEVCYTLVVLSLN